jgi:hypothetical protein
MATTRTPNTWADTERVPDRKPVRGAGRDELAAPATQIVGDREAYLGQATGDVGRRISEDQVELFVSGDAALSLQGELQRMAPEYITLHDVGLAASLRLLSSMAGPAGARVQRLSIRRQGQGVALAVVPFVEVTLADATPVRVYSSDIQADGPTRNGLARVLLAHSRLAVLMVGELPAHVLTAQLTPLHEAMQRGPWPNRDLLLVPLGSSIGLAGPSAQLANNTPVAVHVTPHAAKPKHVWTFVGGAWNRLHGMPGGERALPTELSRAVPKPRVPMPEATTEPMPLDLPSRPAAMPALQTYMPSVTPMPVPGGSSWQDYAKRCALIKGAQACCVFDMHSMSVMASAGDAPPAERLARQGAALLATLLDASRALGLGPVQPEASITTGHHHLLLRPVPGHPGVALHLVLQAHGANLTLARMQLERIAAPD